MKSKETQQQSPNDHPLVDSIGRAATLNKLSAMPVQSSGQDGWIEAESIFLGDDDRLQSLVIGYGKNRWGTENPDVAGSGFIVAYPTRLTYPLISQYVWEGRVLDVSLSNLQSHSNGKGIDGTALSLPPVCRSPRRPRRWASGHFGCPR